MTSTFFERLAQLSRNGVRFVTATVVSRRAPVSSHLGDRAVVYEDGRMEGFVGGSCSREIVRKQALETLKRGQPRLVLIRPDATEETLRHAASAESVVVPMTCASEGAVDVYLEPHTPARMLLVVGFTPVAQAVARLGTLLESSVVRVVTAEEQRDLDPGTLEAASSVALSDLKPYLEGLSDGARSSLAAVVASQGHYDELALEVLLEVNVGFISLLASRKRASTVRELLELQGMSPERIAQIRTPAGLDINAKTPAEVAVSILAEIIRSRDTSDSKPMHTHSSHSDTEQHRAQALEARAVVPSSQTPRPGFALSPVDGEEVEIASALHSTEFEGQTYYFTCANCKRRFLRDPHSFLGPMGAGRTGAA